MLYKALGQCSKTFLEEISISPKTEFPPKKFYNMKYWTKTEQYDSLSNAYLKLLIMLYCGCWLLVYSIGYRMRLLTERLRVQILASDISHFNSVLAGNVK